jgi:hypothetical protein
MIVFAKYIGISGCFRLYFERHLNASFCRGGKIFALISWRKEYLHEGFEGIPYSTLSKESGYG